VGGRFQVEVEHNGLRLYPGLNVLVCANGRYTEAWRNDHSPGFTFSVSDLWRGLVTLVLMIKKTKKKWAFSWLLGLVIHPTFNFIHIVGNSEHFCEQRRSNGDLTNACTRITRSCWPTTWTRNSALPDRVYS
jgi:hypothetical protein